MSDTLLQGKFRVTLTDEESESLKTLVTTGTTAARKLVRARILLLADESECGPAKTDTEIVQALGCPRPNWMDLETYESIPKTLVLREIRLNIVESGCRTQVMTIATTLIDPKQHSTAKKRSLNYIIIGGMQNSIFVRSNNP